MPAMSLKQPDITVRVLDWPFVGRKTSFTLDPRLVDDDDALAEYCENRFGRGTLHRVGETTFEYERATSAPPLLKSLFTKLLNKSYG